MPPPPLNMQKVHSWIFSTHFRVKSVEIWCRWIMEITEYIGSEEKPGDVKTTSVNGITTNSGALTQVWEIKWEGEVEIQLAVCMILFKKARKAWQIGFNILVANLIMSKDIWSRTHRNYTFCSSSLLKEETKAQFWAKIKQKKKMFGQHHVTSHNANASGWKGCQKLCLGRKRMLKQGQ